MAGKLSGDSRKKIAVIGSGLAGLTSAYLLNQAYDVTLFEKEAAIGMGAHAVTFDRGDGVPVTIDFPHRVLSPRYYLNLTNLLERLKVPLAREDYCLSVSQLGGSTFFYWRNRHFFGKLLPTINIGHFLKQPLLYLRLARDAFAFFREANRDVHRGFLNGKSTGEYFEYLINTRGYCRVLIDQMIRPSLAIVATCSHELVDTIPADISMRYLTLALTPPAIAESGGPRGVWRPAGGVNEIVSALSAPIRDIRVATPIKSISPSSLGDGKVLLCDHKGNEELFDHVVFATQANHALRLLKHPTKEHQEILGSFHHESTKLILHTEAAAMPSDRSSWTSFNMLFDEKHNAPMATLWMNRNVSKLDGHIDVFQTWNPIVEIPKDKVLYEFSFERPIMNRDAATAVMRLDEINGKGNVWFVGAYSLYSIPLLESAVLSAYRVAERLGVHTGRITAFPSAPTKLQPTSTIASPLPKDNKSRRNRAIVQWSLLGLAASASAAVAVTLLNPGALGSLKNQLLPAFITTAS